MAQRSMQTEVEAPVPLVNCMVGLYQLLPSGIPMNDHNFHRLVSSWKTAGLWPRLLIGAIGIGTVLAGQPAQASESQILWECSSYIGDAHTRCLEAFAESQRNQIAALQRELQAQQRDRQSLKRSARPPGFHECRPATPSGTTTCRRASSPSPLCLSPVGLGLYLGRPGIFGSPYYYPRSSTVCAIMDHATGATVGNQNSPAPTLFLF